MNRPIVIGRDPSADLVLGDGEVSRWHARVTPRSERSATLEDLGSASRTFANQNELFGPAELDPGDQLLVGVSVIAVRTVQDLDARPSAVIRIPVGMAMVPRNPTYVNPEVARIDDTHEARSPGQSTLDKDLDVRVRRRARLAPLALFTWSRSH